MSYIIFNIMFCAEYQPEVTRKITKIYEGKFDEAHQSWAEVPKLIRDLWFNELKVRIYIFCTFFLSLVMG